eukprot:3668077-Pyramimonas_sp.AAC.1
MCTGHKLGCSSMATTAAASVDCVRRRRGVCFTGSTDAQRMRPSGGTWSRLSLLAERHACMR